MPATHRPFFFLGLLRAAVAALQQLVNARGLEAGLAAATSEEERLAEVRQMEPRYDDMVQRKDEFVEIMANLELAYPKKIDVALPRNMVCGIQDDVVA